MLGQKTRTTVLLCVFTSLDCTWYQYGYVIIVPVRGEQRAAFCAQHDNRNTDKIGRWPRIYYMVKKSGSQHPRSIAHCTPYIYGRTQDNRPSLDELPSSFTRKRRGCKQYTSSDASSDRFRRYLSKATIFRCLCCHTPLVSEKIGTEIQSRGCVFLRVTNMR